MLDTILKFVQEQGIYLVLGLMVVGGIFAQLLASRRYRRLRNGIQSLASLQTSAGQGGAVSQTVRAEKYSGATREERKRGRREQAESEGNRRAFLSEHMAMDSQEEASAPSSPQEAGRAGRDMMAGAPGRESADGAAVGGFVSDRPGAEGAATGRFASDRPVSGGAASDTAAPDSSSTERYDAGEVDSQLLYLRQSLDRIAAGREQRTEEETRKRRKLTPAEEQIIMDILKEYLS